MKILLCGDVMAGRGIDQILSFPSNPQIYEPYVKDAREYVHLAERVNGKINYPVSFDYIWGDALVEAEKLRPDFRVVNLETTITTSKKYLPKGINYRMNPQNIGVLRAFKIDACFLANNHILDWGEGGLVETLEVLKRNGIRSAGAGKNTQEAEEPVILEKGGVRVVIFSFAHPSSGVTVDWQAGENEPGVNLIKDFSEKELLRVKNVISEKTKEGDFIIFSIHAGANWGYEIDTSFREFSHNLIDKTKVDLVFGHSSHHFKGIEFYNSKPIILGAGDFINDYEGIPGYKEFREDLVLMYFLEFNLEKEVVHLDILPMRIRKFSLTNPNKEEIDWVFGVLNRESKFINGKFVKKFGKISIQF